MVAAVDSRPGGVLQDAGKVSAELAKQHALTEFEKYRIVQDRLFESDFDGVVAETKRLGEGGTKDAPRKGKKPCPSREGVRNSVYRLEQQG